LLKRIVAICFIFVATAIAWMILGTTIYARTNSFGDRLRVGVSSIWGEPQTQKPPVASITLEGEKKTTELVDGKTMTKVETVDRTSFLHQEASDIRVAIAIEHRQKGLLWYSTYTVDFTGSYTFQNTEDAPKNVTFDLKYPAQRAIYDGVSVEIDGRPVAFTPYQNGILASANLAAHQRANLRVTYLSHGLDTWSYKMGDDVAEWQNFKLTMTTNFNDIDFPSDTLSPVDKRQTKDGWQLVWRYKNLISGFAIGMAMPEKLQPGPLASQISYFAPVSLLLFFFVIFTITTLRNIELHPMNYFFLAAAFFAFHLLLAYLVDRISIHLAFLICSAVSIFLVVSYLRLVVGLRFAVVEAGLAQFVYLVLFSYSFFLKGFTGLAVTLGCIVTLFIAMQMTGGIRWNERFSGVAIAPATS
jgi:inner membrane protein involved in colicin E2 resistance